MPYVQTNFIGSFFYSCLFWPPAVDDNTWFFSKLPSFMNYRSIILSFLSAYIQHMPTSDPCFFIVSATAFVLPSIIFALVLSILLVERILISHCTVNFNRKGCNILLEEFLHRPFSKQVSHYFEIGILKESFNPEVIQLYRLLRGLYQHAHILCYYLDGLGKWPLTSDSTFYEVVDFLIYGIRCVEDNKAFSLKLAETYSIDLPCEKLERLQLSLLAEQILQLIYLEVEYG